MRRRNSSAQVLRQSLYALAVLAVLFAAAVGTTLPSLATQSLEDALKSLKSDGRVILMRHTQTVPGVGDPKGFKLGSCVTQRNLNELGIKQAKAFGAAIKAARVRIGRVLVSEWCRADDTARYVLEAAGIGDLPREQFWQLNNVWDDDSRVNEQVTAVRAAIAKWRGPGALLMVSHGVTIRPVVGRTTVQGGFFVIQPKGNSFEIVAEGRL